MIHRAAVMALRICVVILLGAFTAATARSEDAPFQHPGIRTSPAELEAI